MRRCQPASSGCCRCSTSPGAWVWASFSDLGGRKLTYAAFFVLGIAIYALAPWAAHSGSLGLFVVMMCVILSMYGGGFATVPAYLADMFDTRFVGTIHGRLLTAWPTAGVTGPIQVNQMRERQITAAVPSDLADDRTLMHACRPSRRRLSRQPANQACREQVAHRQQPSRPGSTEGGARHRPRRFDGLRGPCLGWSRAAAALGEVCHPFESDHAVHLTPAGASAPVKALAGRPRDAGVAQPALDQVKQGDGNHKRRARPRPA